MQSKLHPKFTESQIDNALERVAAAVTDDDELDHVLTLVDPTARKAARERMKPFLKFTPKE